MNSRIMDQLVLTLSLSLLVLYMAKPTQSTAMSNLLFPYGNTMKDNKMQNVASQVVHLSTAVNVLGISNPGISLVTVNNIGSLSFSYGNAFKSEVDVFLSGVDISKGGDIWYRYTKEDDQLNQVQSEVRQALPSGDNDRKTPYDTFVPSGALVVTWDDVTFTLASQSGQNKRNTFQIVFSHDKSGSETFVILNYKTLEWSCGQNIISSTHCNADSGIGKSVAKTGFKHEITYSDGTKRLHTYYLPGSTSQNGAEILQLTKKTNSDIPGKWVFRASQTVNDIKKEERCKQIHKASVDQCYPDNVVTSTTESVTQVTKESITVTPTSEPDTTPPSDQDDDSATIGLIVGLVVGLVALCIIVPCVVVIYIKRKYAADKSTKTKVTSGTTGGTSSDTSESTEEEEPTSIFDILKRAITQSMKSKSSDDSKDASDSDKTYSMSTETSSQKRISNWLAGSVASSSVKPSQKSGRDLAVSRESYITDITVTGSSVDLPSNMNTPSSSGASDPPKKTTWYKNLAGKLRKK